MGAWRPIAAGRARAFGAVRRVDDLVAESLGEDLDAAAFAAFDLPAPRRPCAGFTS